MDLETLRDTFREMADMIDEILELEKQEQTPEVKKQYESVLGRFLIKTYEMEAMKKS